MNKKNIHDIVKNHMETLMEKMVSDFPKNYKNKEYNWILNNFDKENVKSMVFVSSFESKYGNMFEEIARDIAKITYGEDRVPYTLGAATITSEEFYDFLNNFNGKDTQQYVISNLDKKASSGAIRQFESNNRGSGRGNSRTPPTLNQDKVKELVNNPSLEYGKISARPVDLIIQDFDDIYHLIEIKAGGNLDSSKAPGDVQKMLDFYAAVGTTNAELHFATLYNYRGEGQRFTGTITSYIAEDMLLISEDFWEFVLPEDISFEDFKEIYLEVFNELGFNTAINNLIY